MAVLFSNYANTIEILFLSVGILISGILFYVSIISVFEKEHRAFRISLVLSFVVLIPFLIIYLYNTPFKIEIINIVLILIFLAGIVLFFPYRPRIKNENQTLNEKHDERDIMFSRNELIPDTEKYNNYYSRNPDKKEVDDRFREKPGLLSPESKMYQVFSFASAQANLEVIEALKPVVSGKVSENKVEVDALKLTNYIKTWSKKLGAHSIGITELKDYHLYSHKGRRETYGKEINNQHKYAIAVTIEMNNDLIQTAPKGPVIMESTQQYLNSGTIALQIASFIRNLGYKARAHIDGNYEVICPLVACDAGLGEIGRMGLLMTPKLGSRVRISVITTDVPLFTDKKQKFSSMIDFCGICKKCVAACPSQSIPFNAREKVNGVYRWKVNSESCFTYWCSSGTDCGRCIAVCPYSHPNNLIHNFIRWGIKNSYVFRRFALYMDDLFYGRRPKSRNIPSWIDI